MSISNREKAVDMILNRGVIVDALPNMKSLRKRLIDEEPMKIYIGADPTSDTLHLSHAKNYMLLEEFRKLGHKVFVLFGDFTARIGDPSDKTSTRKQLSKKEVEKNVQGWIKQIKPIMDFDTKENPPEIVYNSEWLSKLTMEDVIDLASNLTVQQMIERDMFAKRLEQQKAIYLHEFMYPLMQGYDSVALNIDAELCGTDQTFNALVGRTLLKKFKQKDKFVITVNLMENPITKELMSKSRGTGVFLNTTPFDMYGSIMSQPDEMIEIFLINNTRIPFKEIEKILDMENPRDAKMKTAFEITKIFHGEEKALESQENFIKLVQEKSSIEDLPKVKVNKKEITLYDLVKKCIPEESGSQIRRLISQNAIKIENKTFSNPDEIIEITKEGIEIKIGKKKWFKVEND